MVENTISTNESHLLPELRRALRNLLHPNCIPHPPTWSEPRLSTAIGEGLVRCPPASFLIRSDTDKVKELPRALRSCGAFFLQDFARQKRTLLCPKHNFDKRISLATPIAAGAETLLPPLHLVGASVSHCDRGEAGVNWNSPQPLS